MNMVDLFGDQVMPEQHGSKLGGDWNYPPFSVWNAREGWWADRKKSWISLGIKSEEGRDADAFSLNGDAVKKYDYLPDIDSGTSIFDPVVCELAYRWFCPPGGHIVDPFAGGSVRGIVASVLGYKYTGHELRPEQVAANREQAAAICPENAPHWVIGDSAVTLAALPSTPADMVFSCPPYGDLEVYSDDPADLSAQEWPQFLASYRAIIAASVARMAPDSFAAFVVGEFRDKKGMYRNFVGETVAAFEDAGARFYNEAILVTAVGSLPIRVGKQFKSARKLGKTHQQMLVFVKGCPKKATAKIEGAAA